ncbi:hypothetical protein DFH08DRAFT_1085746, partial [Mycena albidolilacea]
SLPTHSSSLNQWTPSPPPPRRSRTSFCPPSTRTAGPARAAAASSARRTRPSPPSTRTAAPAPAGVALLPKCDCPNGIILYHYFFRWEGHGERLRAPLAVHYLSLSISISSGRW